MRIAALGIVSGYCRESPKPEEFGNAGANWSQIGWRVGVRWQRLNNAIRPHGVRRGSWRPGSYSTFCTCSRGEQPRF